MHGSGPMSELERKAVVHAAWTAKPCCDLHKDDGCCDEDDCGPCCEGCPTCPTLRAKLQAEYEALMARLAAATPEQRAEWERQADEAEAAFALRAARDGEREAWLDMARLPDGRYVCDRCSTCKTHDEVAPDEDAPWNAVCQDCAACQGPQ
jgi:hypothetical protein